MFKKSRLYLLIIAFILSSGFISCGAGSNSDESKSSAKAITAFTIDGKSGTIGTDTISLSLPYGYDKTNLTPEITITGVSVSPASGVAKDFTNPVTYTVTAEDGSTQAYTVTVSVALSTDNDITGFTINGVSGTISGTEISLTLPNGTDVSSLTPTITITGVSVDPASGVTKDFTNPVTYTVTAADNSKKPYKVTVSVLSLAGAIIIDHTCVDVSSLTEGQINQAKNVMLYFEHASVGGNIEDGLNNLASSDSRFSRTNFICLSRGNPSAKAKIDDFYTRLTDPTATDYHDPDDYDAMMMKFCYIDNSYGGFTTITGMFEYYRDKMNSLQSQFPDTIMVWWTIPLETTGDTAKDTYNTLIRNYCNANDKMLYDIADIESHDPSGNAITDKTGECLYPAYTSDGGHPNQTAGNSRLAKAFWNMAYKISQQ